MVDYSGFTTLDVQRTGKLLTVTLNRPDRLNAVGAGMHTELEHLFENLNRDASVGAVLLTGAGRAFCAGGDIKSMAETTADPSIRTARSPVGGPKRLLVAMLEVEQPIIAAVNGPAMGLGATLALCCDVVVMAESAFIADTHVKMGLVAGDGGAVIWPLLLPINTAKYYLMSGERLTGAEAHRLGLVNEVVPQEELLPRARSIAESFANGATWAIRLTKTSVNKIIRDRLNLVLDSSLGFEVFTMFTEDHKEAVAAFAERRPPTFTGR